MALAAAPDNASTGLSPTPPGTGGVAGTCLHSDPPEHRADACLLNDDDGSGRRDQKVKGKGMGRVLAKEQ